MLQFASELVTDESGKRRNHRVRWWSALALLRAMASSPAAAAATLRNRAVTAEAETEEDIEEIGQRAVLDQDELEISEIFDLTPGADPSDETRYEHQSAATAFRQGGREAPWQERRQAAEGHHAHQGSDQGRLQSDPLLPVHRYSRIPGGCVTSTQSRTSRSRLSLASCHRRNAKTASKNSASMSGEFWSAPTASARASTCRTTLTP